MLFSEKTILKKLTTPYFLFFFSFHSLGNEKRQLRAVPSECPALAYTQVPHAGGGGPPRRRHHLSARGGSFPLPEEVARISGLLGTFLPQAGFALPLPSRQLWARRLRHLLQKGQVRSAESGTESY